MIMYEKLISLIYTFCGGELVPEIHVCTINVQGLQRGGVVMLGPFFSAVLDPSLVVMVFYVVATLAAITLRTAVSIPTRCLPFWECSRPVVSPPPCAAS